MIIAIATLLALSGGTPQAMDPKALLASVHAEYLKAGDIEADFVQTYVGGLRGHKKVESGHLWTKQDGRVRWEYNKPEAKIFIYDGKNAYYYEPLNSQVWIYDDLADSKLSTALRLLLGQAKVAEHFVIKPCKTHCDLAQPGEIVFELEPIEPLANIDHVALVVDPVAKRIRLTALFDSLGYRTECRFESVRMHANVPAAKFVYKKPKGVQEMRAGQFGQGKM